MTDGVKTLVTAQLLNDVAIVDPALLHNVLQPKVNSLLLMLVQGCPRLENLSTPLPRKPQQFISGIDNSPEPATVYELSPSNEHRFSSSPRNTSKWRTTTSPVFSGGFYGSMALESLDRIPHCESLGESSQWIDHPGSPTGLGGFRIGRGGSISCCTSPLSGATRVDDSRNGTAVTRCESF